jgi:cytochrome oxidase Cu insertion factor (SCO1/SenC/PrrC family)
MLPRILLVLAFALALSYTPVLGQLGPKEDGTDLSPTDLDRIRIGQPAPDFTLENLDGRRISLSDFRGEKNVVLVFYRGHW